ncbi:hypothetical protein [Krasilnikovia sp. MM14-A1004]|uniref:hypothetical protein n=1 Tax=Krasilnikovia sp. MM14-A1004 TaxID=3373541 RepID=UPI00399D472F
MRKATAGTAVVAAVLLAALLLTAPRHGAGRRAAAEPVPGGATGSPPAIDHPEPETLPAGPVAAADGGSRSGPGGIPLGFPRTADGAVAAGTAWLTVLEGVGMLDATRRPALLAAIGDATFAAAADRRIAARAAGLAPPAGPDSGYVVALARPASGAYRVLDGGESAVRCEVWYPYQLAVRSDGAPPPVARWYRAQLALRWDDQRGDWLLTADPVFADGPDPGEPSPPFAARTAALAESGPGWHTYADAQE